MMEVVCKVCTLNNAATNTYCDVCGSTLKPGRKVVHDLTSSPGGKHVPEPVPLDESFLPCNEITGSGAAPLPPSPRRTVFTSIIDSITCSRCTFANPSKAEYCDICGEHLHTKKSRTSPQYYCDTPPVNSDFSEEGGNTLPDGQNRMTTSESLVDGILPLLHDTLREELSQSQSLCHYRLSCHSTPHISQKGVRMGGDWSCGYRNIQMMCHALMALPTYRYDG